jgi:hypothetical protein
LHELTCEAVRDAAPRFVLDILDPVTRSEVAAHLVRCPRCREAISDMQVAADGLLQLPPPPAEEEGSRSDPVVPGRRRFRVAVTLAAAALLLIGTTFGPEVIRRSTPVPAILASARIIDGQQVVGTVYFYAVGPGKPPSLGIEVRGLSTKGPLSCEAVATNGTVVRLGTLKLDQGRGYLFSSDRLDRAHLSAVVLRDATGRVVASAGLTAGPS